jgi:hypothetical protein
MMNKTAEAKPDPISITLVHNPAGERRRKKLFFVFIARNHLKRLNSEKEIKTNERTFVYFLS